MNTTQTPELAAGATSRSRDRGIYVYIAVFSAVLNTVLLIAPVIAGQLSEQFSLTPGQVGFLFSVELGSFSLATIPAYLWLPRLNLRIATFVFTGIFIIGNVVSGLVTSYPQLLGVRLITSLAAGSIIVIILSISGRTGNRNRAFGIFVVSQLAMGALVLAIIPPIFVNHGVSAVYWGLAVLALLSLPVARLIPGTEFLRTAASAALPRPDRSRLPVGRIALGLLGVLLFYIALSGTWSFMVGIATGAGLAPDTSSRILSVATVAGIASAVTATIIGSRGNRAWLLAVGYVFMAVSILLLFGGPGVVRFAVAAIIFKFTWTFILPFILSSIADLDQGGQMMNTTNLMIGTGFAIGPAVSGVLIERMGGSFAGMLTLGVGGIAFSAICVLAIQKRQSKTTEGVRK
ncbi:MFS transporter [Saxibacter everestensis]|uniref:MFS transporter n=1 Tax=Saxibacter everestensis TaxID=2909229 RepID=A0ABY8QTZ9_9MICO|nr:MFS transporter [Brevibacteriaceae bacterium ZFBP1038]